MIGFQRGINLIFSKKRGGQYGVSTLRSENDLI